MRTEKRKSRYSRIVGIPFVPCVEGNTVALDVEVEAGLQDGIGGCGTINAHPGRGTVLSPQHQHGLAHKGLQEHRKEPWRRGLLTAVEVLPPVGVFGDGTTKVPMTEV